MILLGLFLHISITAQSYPPGDVNTDYRTNIVDALLVAQYYVKLSPDNFHREWADVNCDEQINIVDALLIAQYYVGLKDNLQVCASTDPSELVIEAEDTFFSSGIIESQYPGFSGTGYVNTDNLLSTYIEWTIRTESSGQMEFSFTFANGTSEARGMELIISGSSAKTTLEFNSTTDWSIWTEEKYTLDFQAGTRQIRLTSLSDQGAPNLDKITMRFAGEMTTPSPSATPETTPSPEVSPGEDLYNRTWNLSGNLWAHDPVIIKAQDSWYAFCTNNGILIKSSSNGEYWQDRGKVFPNGLSWHAQEIPGHDGNLWAPDIFYYNNTYYLTYSVSSFGSNRSLIALATNKSLDPQSPDYRWIDQGIVLRSNSSDNFNAIDSNICLDAQGVPWMSFGSFWSGIKMVQLDPGTMKAVSNYRLYSLAYNSSIEAPFIVERKGYYYLFVSWGACCKGVDSTYNIRVGRASAITGPYYDKNGNNMMNSAATLIDQGNTRWKGPGHQAVYLSGETAILVNHAYDANNNGNATLQIRPLYFDTQEWPNLK